ncbi:MAG TPA: carboxymuconolactone decarboxylase family protein [Acidimicrobiales bacterium]|nr:carboxymuconolactone decarboxylase family protein [Acidimicrobiales bacterium]
MATVHHAERRPGGPRIAPLPEDERTPEQQEVIDWLVEGATVNIYTTIGRFPDLARAMVTLGRTLRSGTIPGREREILILRTGWNCRSAYEFAQHRRVAIGLGMGLDDIRRIQRGPQAPGWDPFEATLCTAADELHAVGTIADATWGRLTERYDDRQVTEATMLVGYYHLVSLLLNSLGVPVEDGLESFLPD